MTKKSFNLTILNQSFTIKSDADESHVKQVADYVNRKMHEIVTSNKAISTANVAILAALNIADDLYKLKSKHTHNTEMWMEKVQGVLDRLESH